MPTVFRVRLQRLYKRYFFWLKVKATRRDNDIQSHCHPESFSELKFLKIQKRIEYELLCNEFSFEFLTASRWNQHARFGESFGCSGNPFFASAVEDINTAMHRSPRAVWFVPVIQMNVSLAHVVVCGTVSGAFDILVPNDRQYQQTALLHLI